MAKASEGAPRRRIVRSEIDHTDKGERIVFDVLECGHRVLTGHLTLPKDATDTCTECRDEERFGKSLPAT